jgi:hypothetical protein
VKQIYKTRDKTYDKTILLVGLPKSSAAELPSCD